MSIFMRLGRKLELFKPLCRGVLLKMAAFRVSELFRFRGGRPRMRISQKFIGLLPTIKWKENEWWHVHHHFSKQPEHLWEFWVFYNDFKDSLLNAPVASSHQSHMQLMHRPGRLPIPLQYWRRKMTYCFIFVMAWVKGDLLSAFNVWHSADSLTRVKFPSLKKSPSGNTR